MSAPPNNGTIDSGGMPIKCNICRAETTMDKVMMTPDGMPACEDCFNNMALHWKMKETDLESLR